MKFRLLSIAIALMAVSIFANNATAGDGSVNDRYHKQKVVYHINYPGGDGDKAYLGAMRNIQNHINAVGKENLDLRIVIHGNGIGLLKTAKNPGKVQTAAANLKTQDIKFRVCANTLKGKKIGMDELYEVFDEDIVPSGVAELAHLQGHGFIYIKP
jgi:uncharacterized protein